MTEFFYILIFILGTIVGSFLNVVILRWQTGRTMGGRSGCFSCGHPLPWLDLIPVVSYVWQGGRCRHCRSRISPQYPLVEVLTGVLFFFLTLKIGRQPILLFYWLVASLLVVIVVYDWRHKIIPDELVYLLIVLGGISLWLAPGPIWPRLLAGLVAGGLFALFWLVSHGRWMGLGDGKLALALGLFLGPVKTAVAITTAFWSGALVGLLLIALTHLFYRSKSFTMKSELPFAPFLILGAILAFGYEPLSSLLVSFFQ